MVLKVVGIGEILWDIFPDGPRFGGAPANFACSVSELARNSAEVYMLSAVGNDRLGHDAIGALHQRGVRTSMVQVGDRPTGRVVVELDEAGVATYRFDDDSAWDDVRCSEDIRRFAHDVDAVCFGTLGQRSLASRQAISEFVMSTPPDALRILDVNLRPPFYSEELVLESLALANVLKLNEEELPYVGKLAGCHGDYLEIMSQLADQYRFRCVALTRGADGAAIISGGVVSDCMGTDVDVVDTVGAGDAYTASMTLDLLTDQCPETVNLHAIQVASFICGKAGGTTSFPEELQLSNHD